MNEITKWKILLLKHGIRFQPPTLFNDFPKIENYKLKYRNIDVKRDNFQVYDKGTDKSVIPAEVLLSDGEYKSVTKLRFDENSPILLTIKNGKISIRHENEIANIQIELVEKNKILEKQIPEGISSKQRHIGDYVGIVGLNRITFLFFEGCFNWNCGKNCKFCDLHPKREEEDTVIPSLNNLWRYDMNIEKWWKAQKEEYLNCLAYSLKTVLQESKLKNFHLYFMAGNCENSVQTWNIVEETLNFLAKTIDFAPFNNYLNVGPHDNIERLKRMKLIGLKQVQYNLEVVGATRFADACPGKMNYEIFVEKLYEAVKVFGKSNVRSNFVFGLTPEKVLLEFAKNCAEKGVVMDYSVFQPKKNTQYYNKPAPSFDSVVSFTKKLSGIYKKHNFKPIFDSLSSRSSIINEIYNEVQNGT